MTQLNLLTPIEYIECQQERMDFHRVAKMNCSPYSIEWGWRRDLAENAKRRMLCMLEKEQADVKVIVDVTRRGSVDLEI